MIYYSPKIRKNPDGIMFVRFAGRGAVATEHAVPAPKGKYVDYLIKKAEQVNIKYWMLNAPPVLKELQKKGGFKMGAALMPTKTGGYAIYAPFKTLSSSLALYCVLHEIGHAALGHLTGIPEGKVHVNTKHEAEADQYTLKTLAKDGLSSNATDNWAYRNLKAYEQIAKRDSLPVDPLLVMLVKNLESWG